MTGAQEEVLQRFGRARAALLTTFRRDGTPVRTPVSIASDGDRLLFRTYDKAGKAKRLRRDSRVELAPSTMRGKPTGMTVTGTARLLKGEAARTAGRLLARRHRILQGLLVPFGHRLRGFTTLHFEIRLD